MALGPRLSNLWAAFLDLEPPVSVQAEELMIRHAGALLSAQAGDGERAVELLRSREARAAAALDPKPEESPQRSPLMSKLVAMAKRGMGGSRG